MNLHIFNDAQQTKLQGPGRIVAMLGAIGMIVAPGATPATPSPLFVACAIVPATCVPWPCSSSGVASPSTKS